MLWGEGRGYVNGKRGSKKIHRQYEFTMVFQLVGERMTESPMNRIDLQYSI